MLDLSRKLSHIFYESIKDDGAIFFRQCLVKLGFFLDILGHAPLIGDFCEYFDA